MEKQNIDDQPKKQRKPRRIHRVYQTKSGQKVKDYVYDPKPIDKKPPVTNSEKN